MIISVPLSWQAVQWPLAGTDATHYAIFRSNGTNPEQVVTDIIATVTYDDATPGDIFVIRPTDNATPTPAYGPAQTIMVGPGPLNNRAWFRAYIRRSISDRIDTNVGNATNLLDDEINDYLNDAIRKYSGYFPREVQMSITLESMKRDYPLPTNFLAMIQVQYRSADTNFKLILREEPFKGGETTPQSWVGYPKLGIFQPAWGGRFFSGRFEIHDDGTGARTMTLDYDPPGDGDSLFIHYRAYYDFPTDDLSPLSIPIDDIELLSLYVQAKCWVQIEARDVYLSRFRSREDGARRDDLPTELMSTRLFHAWQTWIQERQALRPKNIRLVRRT